MATVHHHKDTGSSKAASYSGNTSDDCNEIEVLMQALITVEAAKLKNEVNIVAEARQRYQSESHLVSECVYAEQ